MPHPLGRGVDVFREFLVWPKFYVIVLYRVILYNDISMVYSVGIATMV